MKAMTALPGMLLLGLAQISNADDLGWLVGCWETPDKAATEVWVREQDGSLSGFNVVLDENRIAFYEVLRINTRDSKIESYTAHPVGQATTTFELFSIADQEIKFSNPAHDYPQEIAYKRVDDLLYATISALGGKNPQSFNKRACETDAVGAALSQD